MIDVNLFAGAGGLAIGLQSAGFAPIHLFEKDPNACATLRHNSGPRSPTLCGFVFEQDVKEVDWRQFRRKVRLIAAAAPCQPFSLAGKHLASEDGRNLFPEVLRAIRYLRPDGIVIENVRGLLRDDFGDYFDYILRQLECPLIKPRQDEIWRNHDARIRRHQRTVGYIPEYHVSWRLLNAADYGVPQNRLRVFIVATRYDLPPYRFPQPTHSRSALIHGQKTGEYWRRHRIRTKEILLSDGPGPDPLEEELPREPWYTVRDAIADLPEPSAQEDTAWMNHWLIVGARVYAGHSGSMMDWPAKTVKAGVHGVPGGENTVVLDDGRVRYFTFRELARLQSFPDSHFFKGARIHVTRQIGNAVPAELARAVARPLFKLMTDNVEQQEQEIGGSYGRALARI
jgi:DNA (cytosine-5)-methyltransferase 1